MYEIDKNIPIPEGPKRYPFQKMEVGDSFLIDGEKVNTCSGRTAAQKYGKRHNKRFRCEQEGNGVRIWRVL